MLRTCCVNGDIGKVDVRRCNARKLNLSLFRCFLKSLHSHLIAAKINSTRLFELINDPVHNSLVKVVAAEVVVTCRCKNLLNAVAHLDDGNIECTAAEVINHNLLVVFLINTVSKSCGCRLVDDSLNLKAGNVTCVLCCLTLSVGEVSRNCDNSLGNLLAEVSLCVRLELLKNHCGNFLRGVFLVVDSYLVI